MTIRRRTFVSGVSLALGFGVLRLPLSAYAATSESTRVALRGYDPVSYFKEGHPEKGSAEITAAFDDATYWFKDQKNRASFTSDPEKYAPQYSGFCALTVAHGEKAEPDPEAWTITNGKLYVFQAKTSVPVFKEQTGEVIASANRNWPALQHSP